MASLSLSAQKAMNRPYIDDKLFHFGFSLGVNFTDYSIRTFDAPQTGLMVTQTGGFDSISNALVNARCTHMLPGFSVGFIADVRLCRYLNLRLVPALHFSERDITYCATTKNENGEDIDVRHTTSLLAMPVAIPLELKWSAERCGNYRPYCTLGAGVSYNCFENREKPLLPQRFDYFMEVGAGCDFYFSWFKFCPQIKYTLGFNNLAPTHQPTESGRAEYLNSSVIDRLRSHMITLVFNFE